MLNSDVLFGFRLRLFELAAERGVSEACRVIGVHRSTYYRWKDMVERSGLEMLRPRERRRHRSMPNQLSALLEQRMHRVLDRPSRPGAAAHRDAHGATGAWGGLSVSPERRLQDVAPARAQHAGQAVGVGGRLCRAPFEPPRASFPNRTSRPRAPVSWSASTASTSVGLHGHHGAGLADTPRSTRYSSYAWAELVVTTPLKGPTATHTSCARAPGRGRAPTRRLAARAGADRQRLASSARRAFATLSCRARHPPQPHPVRAPTDQRQRRTGAPNDPRGVLATNLRAQRARSAACAATSRATCTTTTRSAPTPVATPRDERHSRR